MNAPRYIDDLEAQAVRSEEALAKFDDDDDDDVITPPLPQGFVIDTPTKAEWAVMTLLSSEAEIARREAECKRYKKQHEHLEQFLLAALDEFYEKNPPHKGRTIHLANGGIGKRVVPGGLRISDEAKVKEWARATLPAAIVPSFVENLDKAIAREGLKRFYNEQLAAAFNAQPPDLDNDEALARALQKADEAMRAVGAEMKTDEEKIYVKAPKAPRSL